ncbi:MAG: hypothetical protein J6B08_03400 [Ruminiclostridium sp.]|nr:hypothetical protein [Ruminiclostridium sp.]
MPEELITSAVCPGCGAPLKPVDEKGNMLCEFCGAVSLDNRHTFKHVSHDFEKDLSFHLRNAQALIDADALSAYHSLIREYGADYRVWWGMIVSKTFNFTRADITEPDYRAVEEYHVTAMKSMPEAVKKENEALYQKWRASVFEYNDALAAAYRRHKIGRAIITLSFWAVVVAFLVFFHNFSKHLVVEYVNDGLLAIGYAMLSIAVFTLVLGIASIICRVTYANALMNITSLCCAVIIMIADRDFAQGFEAIAGYLAEHIFETIVMFLAFQLSTLISRIPAKISKDRG